MMSRSCGSIKTAQHVTQLIERQSLVYEDKPQTLDHLEDNIRRFIADIRPHMLEKVIENWTSRLDYIRARQVEFFIRTQREYSACVEAGTIDLSPTKRCNFNNFKNYFSSNDITCEEVVGSVFICVEENQCFSLQLLDTSYVRATRELEKKVGSFRIFSKMYKNALKEDLIRVVEDLDGTVESTDTIAKLKTKIEKSSTFESDAVSLKL
ncbi:hypothetical protein TNCV_672611 [Trichonephila clavipes]|nr:hypothetical protein TNCV_672611 [Trichonephila clavipes]